MNTKVQEILFKTNPYENLPFQYETDMQGWGSKHHIFFDVLNRIKPSLVVEVGTWKGASAIHMANICRDLNLDTEVVCIDTWLGNWQHWSRSSGIGSIEDLKIHNGMPRLYYQFMSNVIAHGLQNSITPLPLTGVAGAKLFKHLKIRPQVIYIDGDHEYESVLFDLNLWLAQLADGGVLIGDDYNWPGVQRAVSELRDKIKLNFNLIDEKFTLQLSEDTN